MDEAKMLAAQSLINQMLQRGVVDSLADTEFRVFSQFGDDGIIQYLIHNVDIPEKSFIEFGSSDYVEANTRFWLVHDNWSGLVMDGDSANIDYIKHDSIYWLQDLTAVTALITRDNINDLIRENGFEGEIGILSIDLDGVDYWVWERIFVVDPVIVIVEYNSIFGFQQAVTVPYCSEFYRYHAHYSGLYWGASPKSLRWLAERKGYAFVGCNSAANNAFFVRKDKIGRLRTYSPETGFRLAKWSDSRDASGHLNWLRGQQKTDAIKDMQVIDVITGRTLKVGELRS